MLKVEKKRKKGFSRGGWLIAALAVLAGIVAAVLIISRKPEPASPGRYTPRSGTIVHRDVSELRSVTIRQRGEESWTLLHGEDGSLSLEGDTQGSADSTLGERVADAMVNLVYADILTEDPADYSGNPEEFGLADPLLIATGRYSDGTETTIRVGSAMGIDEGWFYMTVDGQDTLYALSPGLMDDLDVSREMLHPVRQPEVYAALIDRIEVLSPEGDTRVCWALQGAVTDPEAGVNWQITAPFTYAADEETVSSLKKSAENLRMGSYIGPADEEILRENGLDHPMAVITFHMAAGSTGTVSDAGVYDVVDRAESTVRLTVGEGSGEHTNAVLFGDEVFAVNHLMLSPFLDTDPMDTAARYTAAIPLDSLSSMTVEREGEEKVEYALERVTEKDPETGDEIRVTRCWRNGEEYAWEAFSAAYERLLTVTVSGRLPEGAAWEEQAHTKYAFRAVSGGTHTVELKRWDGVHDAVVMDGNCIFYLIANGMNF